jgi:hypothetical protein
MLMAVPTATVIANHIPNVTSVGVQLQDVGFCPLLTYSIIEITEKYITIVIEGYVNSTFCVCINNRCKSSFGN